MGRFIVSLPLLFAPLVLATACGSKSSPTGSSGSTSNVSSSASSSSSSSSSSSGSGGGSGGSTSVSSSSGAGVGGSDAGTGGSASDAGTGTGGSSSDAGTGGSLSCGTYKYCDGFEAYSGTVANGMTLGPWLASVAGVTATVDSVKPHSGSKSLHIVVPASTAAHATLEQTTKPKALVAGNNLFGRAMVFYSSTGGNGLPLGVHSWLFDASGIATLADGGVNMNMGGGSAASTPQINYHFVDGGEASVDTGTWTAGAWHCFQWQYDGAGSPPADDAKLWIDGKLEAEAPASKGWDFATPWDTFYFGFTHYQTLTNTVEVFLDDFAMDGAMVPCPP